MNKINGHACADYGDGKAVLQLWKMHGIGDGRIAGCCVDYQNATQAHIKTVAQGEADMKKLLDERLAAHKHLSGA